MRVNEWVRTQSLINGKQCVQHCTNESDIQIIGRYGVILQTGQDSFTAIIDNHRLYNRLAPLFGLAPDAIKGEELLIKFSMDQFKLMHKAIKVPKRIPAQIELAKRFEVPKKGAI